MELLPYYSPEERYLSVQTSTASAGVGEYVVLHVRSSFPMRSFGYVVSAGRPGSWGPVGGSSDTDVKWVWQMGVLKLAGRTVTMLIIHFFHLETWVSSLRKLLLWVSP